MNSFARRPLSQPFSEPVTETPQEALRPRLLAVERAPFLEPATSTDDAPLPQMQGSRRRLGHGGIAIIPSGDPQ